MNDGAFIFHVGPYDIDRLLPQVSKALQKRVELVSRKQIPGLWKLTDTVNAIPKHPRNPLFRRITSVVCIALGVFLFIPGLMEPKELLIPLIWGAVAIASGIWGLWSTRKNKGQRRKKDPYDEAARQLLEGKDVITKDLGITVSFSGQGMSLSSGSGGTSFVPYGDFECVIETTDALLLIYGEIVTLLQKCDLDEGDITELGALLSGSVAAYQSVA